MVSVSDDGSAEFLPSLRRRQPIGDTDTHPLLVPLADAADAMARLEASAAAAPPPVAEGLRARVAYREAAGWVAHAHTWIHPRDLALREAGLTGSKGIGRRVLMGWRYARLWRLHPSPAARHFHPGPADGVPLVACAFAAAA